MLSDYSETTLGIKSKIQLKNKYIKNKKTKKNHPNIKQKSHSKRLKSKHTYAIFFQYPVPSLWKFCTSKQVLIWCMVFPNFFHFQCLLTVLAHILFTISSKMTFSRNKLKYFKLISNYTQCASIFTPPLPISKPLMGWFVRIGVGQQK